MKSPIGLDTVQSQALAAELNKLLASYQILYMNVRGFHWNIRGNQFFELHLKFEEIYNDLLLKVVTQLHTGLIGATTEQQGHNRRK